MNPPPPPPPHGANPKSSGLPDGPYDIFIIPPHSSGGGFIYLPSLKPNINSFIAGVASGVLLCVILSALAPAAQAWWNGVKGSGGGVVLVVVAVGLGAWALGRTQTDGGPGPGGGPSGGTPGSGSGAYSGTHSNTHSNGYAGAGAAPPPPRPGPAPGPGSAGGPRAGWQRANPPPGATGASGPQPDSNTADGSAKGAWERAREETKRKEEERKTREAEQKRKDELERKLREAREKEARERESRERRQKEEEAKAKEKLRAEVEKELEKEREKDRERQKAKEKTEAEVREREIQQKLQKEKDEKAKAWEKQKERIKQTLLEREKAKLASQKDEGKPSGGSYAFSATGEKVNPWPNGRPASQPPSPVKRPPPPTAKTFREADDDAYSYRPYDKPKKPMHSKAPSSIYSEGSYAPSQSTSRTTPPPSHRGPYSTKDPDKIVIKAVYAFNNAFMKTPTSQLVSGVGSVTDGLILRVTTEGLFIDDDVRGVPQREWDVKAWTMKLVEVWCPSFRQGPAGNSASARVASSAPSKNNPIRRLWGMDKDKAATSEETDALLIDMLQLCRDNCRSRSASSASSAYSASTASSYDDRSSVTDSAYASSVGSWSSPSRDKRTDKRGQTGELKAARLHVLRASIRDQEGKKYIFVISEEESWKVSVGLQRLRKGSQVRALGVSGMSTADARGTLEHLGWV
ncbi:Uncharacterized protein BP5553_00437 [Venustampulla echinocandica]|uniref:Reticulocyte-binding protein 2 like protein a n=1 Tax=Venustampulla echinocandica TaxID=2656787 RepID=A0A370TY66_9HELO|nr:Uncharacterized protein BP5553_00437 [Venustampulla echinocandica]RDL40458.1 Uncharacterized protein BP5553_00437 [Venustampulla echinocandica]